MIKIFLLAFLIQSLPSGLVLAAYLYKRTALSLRERQLELDARQQKLIEESLRV